MHQLVRVHSRLLTLPFLGLIVFMAACSSGNPQVSKSPQSFATSPAASPTKGAATPSLQPPNPPGPQTGTIVITLKDANAGLPEGVPVQVDGPITKQLVSNGKGQVMLEGPPGNYRFKVVVGCTQTLKVLSGGAGSGGIVAGTTANGQLNVDWQHRITPSPPVFASEGASWKIGQTVSLKYGVIDRCNEEDRAPGAVYPTFVFKTGPTTKLVGRPALKSDGDGFGFVSVTCASEGPPQVVVVDSKNRRDTLDLGAAASSGTDPYTCAN